MKNKEPQPSEALAKHFAPYREETPLLSAPEIEKLLTRRDMLPNNHTPTPALERRGSLLNIRRIIMTLSGITGLGLAAYFAFFAHGNQAMNGIKRTNATIKSLKPLSSLVTADTTRVASAALPPKSNPRLRTTLATRGPWSAGNDQIYADLTPEELARLGIVVSGDTVIAYKLPPNDTIESMELTKNSIGGGNTRKNLPEGIHAPKFYPVLMTFGDGHGVAYVVEENGRTKEWGMVGDGSGNNVIRDWLKSPGTEGYLPVWWKTISIRPCDTCEEIDKMTLEVGKNFPKPIFPFSLPHMNGFSDSTKLALTQLADYYCGKGARPTFNWPKNLFIKADTITTQEMLDTMNSEENTTGMKHLRSMMANLNELVPIIIRSHGGSGAPGPNDFIFWYEPSEELFNALPPAQAALFRAKLAEPPHCFTAPNAVLTSAEVTYCVADAQEVHVTVQDLSGKTFLVMSQQAVAGDNLLDFPTATLPSGMYIVTVEDKDGSKRSQRLWVENAHPKQSKEIDWNRNSLHAPNQIIFVNTGDNQPSAPAISDQATNLIIPSLELDSSALSGIGVQSNSMLAAYYTQSSKPDEVNYMGILRTWGAIINALPRSSVTVSVPAFEPSVITDGIGRKRVFAGDSDYQSLVPVLMRAGLPSDSIGARDLIFWYQPTPEFLAALPDSARTVAEAMIGSTHNASIAEVHGAIETAIAFPNPSRGKFSVKLKMNGERNLTFTLRNLLGQKVAPPTEAHVVGESDQPLDFGTVPEGVYLLDIASDKGERYLHRIVIAR